jgi:DNA-binding Xre family transcriptional regulator
MAKLNPRIGSNFDDFLADEGLLEETTALALKRVIAWQLDEARKARGLSKKAMAERMNTSRAQLDRILDANDASLTLETLSRASRVVGCRVSVALAAA